MTYPALFERGTKETHSLEGADSFIVGRSQQADLPVLDVQCSRRQFELNLREGQYHLTSLSTNSPTYLDGSTVESSRPMRHGSIVQAGSCTFVFLEREDAAALNGGAADAVRQQATMMPTPASDLSDRTMMHQPDNAASVVDLRDAIPLTADTLIGRDEQRATVCLPHPQVSRLHAQVSLRGQTASVVDLSSANGTYVNGERITRSVTIDRGDQIDIGPYALTFDGRSLIPRSRVDNVELACRGLSQVVKNRETGGTLTILDDVNLVIHPREFVCLLGPSGSGKSTLLSALSARVPACQGQVSINGEDLYENFEALKRDIAVVPQKDVLHDLLSVESALTYTARLRLPPDTSPAEIKQAVDDMLRTVALSPRAKTQIVNLSGGQLKRASLANEIVSKPSLLFLDEVTSGLDEQTDADMMYLFRQIADAGKTVVCITHSLAHVEQFCHRVVILAEGGKLAFVGTPAEALSYFEVDRLGGVYEKLATRTPEQWKDAFQSHPLHREHVGQHFDSRPETPVQRITAATASRSQRVDQFRRQATLLTSRYLQIQLADSRSLGLMLGQCFLVGILIVLLFGNISEESDGWFKSGSIMFLTAISVFWFGCNNAAKEIVKERTIYDRERSVNLQVGSFLASKLFLLGVISLLQTALLYTIVVYGTAVDTSIGQFVLLTTLAVTGVCLGLLISAASSTTDMAVTIVPLTLIPQIIFSGSIAAVTGFAKFLASIGIVVYWAYGGLLSCFDEATVERLGYGEWSAFGPWVIIVMHGVAYLAVATLLLRSSGGPGSLIGLIHRQKM